MRVPSDKSGFNISRIRREIYSLQSLNLLWWGQRSYAQGRRLLLLLHLLTNSTKTIRDLLQTDCSFIHHYIEYLPRSTCSGPRWWWPAGFQTKEPHQGQTLELWSSAQTGFYILPNPYSDTQAETQIRMLLSFMFQFRLFAWISTVWLWCCQM